MQLYNKSVWVAALRFELARGGVRDRSEKISKNPTFCGGILKNMEGLRQYTAKNMTQDLGQDLALSPSLGLGATHDPTTQVLGEVTKTKSLQLGPVAARP